MNIEDLINKLQDIKDKHGNLPVCVAEKHEYWGTLEAEIMDYNIAVRDHLQPKGPKSGKSEKGVLISYEYIL